MNTPPTHLTDERLKEAARRFRYPSTPDMTEVVIDRIQSGSGPRVRMRSAWVILSLILLLSMVLFAVPDVRAEIVRFFQVGVVRIFPASATQTAIPTFPQVPLTTSPRTTTLSGLAGKTTLETAQVRLSFPMRLPTYPTNLGKPEQVFLQEDGPMLILVWTDPVDSQKALLSLYEIGPGSVIIRKFEPRVIQETQVNGRYAVWVQGPYLVQLTDGTYAQGMLVAGNTLIWEENGITYRLESDLGLEETIKIAESLK